MLGERREKIGGRLSRMHLHGGLAVDPADCRTGPCSPRLFRGKVHNPCMEIGESDTDTDTGGRDTHCHSGLDFEYPSLFNSALSQIIVLAVILRKLRTQSSTQSDVLLCCTSHGSSTAPCSLALDRTI